MLLSANTNIKPVATDFTRLGGVYEKIIDYVVVGYKLYLCLVLATSIRVVIACRKKIREICLQEKKTMPAYQLEAVFLLFLSEHAACRCTLRPGDKIVSSPDPMMHVGWGRE